MKAEFHKQTLECPVRKRTVEVSYTRSGHWPNRKYEVIDCPASFDGVPACQRICKTYLENQTLGQLSTVNERRYG